MKIRIYAFVAPNKRNYYLPQRLKESFVDDFAGWFEYQSERKSRNLVKRLRGQIRLSQEVPLLGQLVRNLKFIFRKGRALLSNKLALRFHLKKIKRTEEKLSSFVSVGNTDEEFIGFLKDWKTTTQLLKNILASDVKNVLVVSGGPIIPFSVIEMFDFAINQHAGMSPRYRGSLTNEQALFRRDLDNVGSTVHLMTNQVDGGEILRSRLVQIRLDDKPADIFIRSVLLGSELITEVIEELKDEGCLQGYQQDQRLGATYKSSDFSRVIVRDIYSRRFWKWLKTEIKMKRS